MSVTGRLERLAWSRSGARFYSAVTAVAVVIGVVTSAVSWRAVAALPALLVMAWALTKPVGRLIVVVLGAMLVFQSSDGITGMKLAYLCMTAVAFGASLVRIVGFKSEAWFVPLKPIITATLVTAGVLVVASVVGLLHGHDPVLVARDLMTYVLLVAAPIVGIDAGERLSLPAATRLAAGAGALAAVGFAVSWLNRRGVSSLSQERLVLASLTLAALGTCFALAHLLVTGPVLAWLPLSVGIPVCVLVTGTRTGVVLAVGLLAIFGARHKAKASLARGSLLIVVLGVLLVGGVQLASSLLTSDESFLRQRTADATQFFTAGAAHDRSYLERSRAYEYTRQVWERSPAVGEGVGYVYPSVSGQNDGGLGLDSPILLLSKFGLLGAAGLLVALILICTGYRQVRRRKGPDVSDTAARAYLFVLIAILPFGTPLEDKGTALSLLLLIAVLTARASMGGNDARVKIHSRREIATRSSTALARSD